MLRKSRPRFFFPGMQGGGGAPGGGNFNPNALQQMMQQQQQGGGGGCNQGGGFNPAALSQLRQQMQSQMTPQMQEQMRNQMMQNMGGKNGGKIGIGMMGVGVNEKGKKTARAAKIEFDMATGKMTKDFHEKQLDPDDAQLPKETVENYDTEDCIEINLDEAEGKIEGGKQQDNNTNENFHNNQQNSGRVETVEAETVTVKSGNNYSKQEEEVLEIVIEDVPDQRK